MMVFVIPHNFLAPIVPKMEGAFAPGAIGISLIKGIEFEKDGEFKGIAFVDFETVEAATKAVALAGTPIAGRPIRLNFS